MTHFIEFILYFYTNFFFFSLCKDFDKDYIHNLKFSTFSKLDLNIF